MKTLNIKHKQVKSLPESGWDNTRHGPGASTTNNRTRTINITQRHTKVENNTLIQLTNPVDQYHAGPRTVICNALTRLECKNTIFTRSYFLRNIFYLYARGMGVNKSTTARQHASGISI